MRPSLALATVALFAALVLAGCGGPGVRPDQDAQGRYVVHLKDASFSPQTARIPLNGTILWVNDSRLGHDVRGPDFASGEPGSLPMGASYQHTFTEKGTFEVFCYAHHSQGMISKVVVE